MDHKVYTQYYLDQSGHGLSGIGRIYRKPRYYQNGRGIGSLFAGIMKSLKPMLKSTAKAVGKQSLKAGRNIAKSMGKTSFKDSLKENGKRMLSALAEKGAEQIEKFNSMNNIGDLNALENMETYENGQAGNGKSLSFTFRRKKKGFKRNAPTKLAQSSKTSKRVRKAKEKHSDIFS